MIVADKIDRGILSFALCEHPEDLGVVDSGQWPASIWQSQRHLHLVNERGWSSFGLRQCDHGCDRPKPTRMVSPFDTIASGVQGWVGLPIFSAKGAYEGPIEWCDHDHSGTKIQKTNPGEAFKSGEYSAYPALLCKSLAKAIVQEWILRSNGVLNTFDTPSEGRVRLVKSKIPTRTCIDEVQDLKSVVYTGRGGTL
jgi:hypothetical protein